MKLDRRFLVPEVVQISATDCGPAALTALLGGFGISVDYQRIRETCRTDRDGTSIDTLEDLALMFGLDAEQVLVPLDHVVLREAGLLPGIVVVRHPGSFIHFVLAWSRHRRWLQVMDPAAGRQWVSCARFLEQAYVHHLTVPASAWREWAGSEEFIRPLSHRLSAIGIRRDVIQGLIDEGLRDANWQTLARLDAATRMMSGVVRHGRVGPRAASHLLEAMLSGDGRKWYGDTTIPDRHWSVRAAATEPTGQVRLVASGAVVVRARARRAQRGRTPERVEPEPARRDVAPEAFGDGSAQPVRDLIRFAAFDGLLAPGAVAAALALAAAAVVLEALLFRAFFDLPHLLQVGEQRLLAAIAAVAFLGALLLSDVVAATATARLGRRLEARLRIAVAEALPRLAGRYFESRLASDLAQRAHSVRALRLLPPLAGDLLRAVAELTVTAVAIAWLDPRSAPIAFLAAMIALGVPLGTQYLLAERDLRERNHSGALSRFYLEGLLGLMPIRTHCAERALRREHESLLLKWASAGLALQRVVVVVEGAQALSGFALAVWLLMAYLGRTGDTGGALLLVYWTLNLPLLGQEIALLARQYPAHRNVAARLLEPLRCPAQEVATLDGAAESKPGPVAIRFEEVGVRAAGRMILEGIDVVIERGSHIAVVGASGAGKSTFVGLLLGWYRPASGRIFVDGTRLDGAALRQLRRDTAWVDPVVHLWNRSLFDNLAYGAPPGVDAALGQVIHETGLYDLLRKLPRGLQTPLGDSGGLVSAGEGERVRFGRALLRAHARLVILDEPFRGLERQHRRELLARARERWRHATVLCITHDIGDSATFDRVLVMDAGRIVEDGAPSALASVPASRYRALLESERAVRALFRADRSWRILQLDRGRLGAKSEADDDLRHDGAIR